MLCHWTHSHSCLFSLHHHQKKVKYSNSFFIFTQQYLNNKQCQCRLIFFKIGNELRGLLRNNGPFCLHWYGCCFTIVIDKESRYLKILSCFVFYFGLFCMNKTVMIAEPKRSVIVSRFVGVVINNCNIMVTQIFFLLSFPFSRDGLKVEAVLSVVMRQLRPLLYSYRCMYG